MKNLVLLALLTLTAITTMRAQQGMNYQAVARNANGTPVANTLVAVRISILNGSTTGNVVYAERDTATTNSFGLFTVVAGNGQVLTGSWAGINWASGTKYLEVDLDITGGTNYTNMGVTQLLSVPYAFYADSAGNTGPTGASGPTGDNGPTGPTGGYGPTGPFGAVGVSGATGPSGVQGATGVSGTNGATGATGAAGTTSYTGLKHHCAYITNITTWTNIATDTADILIITQANTASGNINGVLHNGGDEIIIVNNSNYNWNINSGQTVPSSVPFFIAGGSGSYGLAPGGSIRAFYEPVSNAWWLINPQ